MELHSPWLRARGRLFDVCSDVNDENLPAVGLRLSATCSTTSISSDELHLYATELLTISEMNAVFGCLCLLKVGGDEERQQLFGSDFDLPSAKLTSAAQKLPLLSQNTLDADFFSRELSVGSELSWKSQPRTESYGIDEVDYTATKYNEADLRVKKLVLKKLLQNHVSKSALRYISKCLLLRFGIPARPLLRDNNDAPCRYHTELYELLAKRLRSTSSRLCYRSSTSLLAWRPRRTQMRLPPRPRSLIQDAEESSPNETAHRDRRYTAPEDAAVAADKCFNVQPLSRFLGRHVFRYFSPRFLNLIGIYDSGSEDANSGLPNDNISLRTALKSVLVKSLTQLVSSCRDDRLKSMREHVSELSEFELVKSIHRMSCYSTLLVESTQQQLKEVDLGKLKWIAAQAKNSVEGATTPIDSGLHDKNLGLCPRSNLTYNTFGIKTDSITDPHDQFRNLRTHMCYPLSWYIEYSLLYFICLVSPELAPVSATRRVEPPAVRWLAAHKVFRGVLAICNVLQNYYAKVKKQSTNDSVTVRAVPTKVDPNLELLAQSSLDDSFEMHMELLKSERKSTRSNSTEDDGISTSESFCGVGDSISSEENETDTYALRDRNVGQSSDIISRESDGAFSLPLLELSEPRNQLVISKELFTCIEEAALPLENHFKAICRWPINPDILLKHVEEFLDIPCIRTNQVDSEWAEFVQHCIGPLSALCELDAGKIESSQGRREIEEGHDPCRMNENEYFARWRYSMYTKLSNNFHNTLLRYYERLSISGHPQSIGLRMAESCVRLVHLAGESENCFGPPQIPLKSSMVRTGQKSDPTLLLLPFIAADILINLKRCSRILFKHNFGDGGHNLWMHQRLRDCCHIIDMLADCEKFCTLQLPPRHASPWLNSHRPTTRGLDAKHVHSVKSSEFGDTEDRSSIKNPPKKVSTIISDLLTTHIRGDVFCTTFRLQLSAVPLPLTYHEAEILQSFNIAYDRVNGVLRNIDTNDLTPPAEAALEEVCVSIICRWLEEISNEFRNLMSWNFLSNKLLTEPTETPPLNDVTQWLHQPLNSR